MTKLIINNVLSQLTLTGGFSLWYDVLQVGIVCDMIVSIMNNNTELLYPMLTITISMAHIFIVLLL